MSRYFTRSFREELARVPEERTCCRMALLAGLIHTCGTFLIRGGTDEAHRYEVKLETPVQAVARLAYSRFKTLGLEVELLVYREPHFRHRLLYEVKLPGSLTTLQTLNELGLITDQFQLHLGIARRVVKKGCCRSAFLRGCLMGAASANAPERETHLEIATSHQAFAQD
ncbi:MAG: DNA-binding protein WhiA, partial [Thermoleophilia bacterium]|nr:DNA-binding protein WhiA [Thermoleophilia bacterium]